jgi:hypothetical protein
VGTPNYAKNPFHRHQSLDTRGDGHIDLGLVKRVKVAVTASESSSR